MLTRGRFVDKVREALDAAGINSKHYAGHSFRAGAATTAAQRGVPEATIKALGRWESAAYLTYISCPEIVWQTFQGKSANDSEYTKSGHGNISQQQRNRNYK